MAKLHLFLIGECIGQCSLLSEHCRRQTVLLRALNDFLAMLPTLAEGTVPTNVWLRWGTWVT
jgi:hypothetical protein